MRTPFRRLAATVAVALMFGLVLSSAAPANAETLRRHGKKTVKIMPSAVTPPGAQRESASVTVWKGKRLVAYQRAYYKAKKGTYKATSTVVYRRPQTFTVTAGDVFAQCRVTNKVLTSDRTDKHDWFDDSFYYAGQVTVRYTGDCVDDIYIAGSQRRFTWTSSWSDDTYVMTDDTTDASAATRAALVLADAGFKVGDMDYVDGADMSALPPAFVALGDQKTMTATRKVKVK